LGSRLYWAWKHKVESLKLGLEDRIKVQVIGNEARLSAKENSLDHEKECREWTEYFNILDLLTAMELGKVNGYILKNGDNSYNHV
jgi:hypothetical protein